MGALAFSSCKKKDDASSTKPNPTSSTTTARREIETDPEEIKFDKMVELSTIGLKNIRTNAQFASLVHSMVSNHFDDDDNVLLKDLSARCVEIGVDLKAEIITALNDAERADLIPLVDEAVDGFTYDSRVLYMQIYIPSFAAVDKTITPVLGANHEEDEVVEGFDINNGPIEITEVFAHDHLTWILSVNESVDNNGQLPPVIPAGRGSAAGDYTVQARKILLTEQREGFPNGKAEVSFAKYRSNLGNCSTGLYVMGNIGKYAKSEDDQPVAGAESFFVPLAHNFDPANPANPAYLDKVNLIFFERDVRKKFKRIQQVIPGCNSTLVEYISKNPEPWGRLEIKNQWIYGAANYFSYSYDWTADMNGLRFNVEML